MREPEKQMGNAKPKRFMLSSTVNYVLHLLPAGGSLPEDVWRKRHRFLLTLTWVHVAIIALVGLVFGYRWDLSFAAWFTDGTVLHTIGESLPVALFAGMAAYSGASRAFRATAVGFGLMSASAILVHLSGGYIELHFHFFVMIAFLALYQDWIPYLLAIVYVAIHHGVIGVLWPEAVFNHAAAFNAPWTWAGIHAFFVLWASVASVIAWRFNETAFARTKLILESAGDGIYGLDEKGKVTFINPAAIKMLGLDGGKIVGKPMEQIVHHTRKDGAAFPAGGSPILTTLGDGVSHQGTEELFLRMDCTSIPVDYLSTPIFERGELIGAVVSFRDVTERQQAELALADKARELARSNTELEQFAYVASHDLQEPLRMVSSYTQLLARRYKGKLGSDADEFIGYAVDGATRMQTLIQDLLAYSRVGTKGRDFESTDCEGLLDRVLGDLKVAIKESGAVVTHDPLPTVTADGTQLGQLLQNLIGNAIKFRNQEPPLVHVSSKRNGKEWILSVRDNGIGIDPRYAERIFVIFQRLHKREEYQGTGIGLAVCKKIVERHGGRIWVESNSEKGATFYFTLPAQS
jgi:PAS domain S-box-containing protein